VFKIGAGHLRQTQNTNICRK